MTPLTPLRLFKIFSIFLLVGILGFPALSWSSGEPDPVEILLGPSDLQSLEKMPAFKKLRHSTPKSVGKDKISYLFARIHLSRCEFVRNGGVFKGPRAAYHLMSKYAKRLDQVKTPEDFIENIASRSNTSGEIYLIRFPDGKEYPTRDVLYNELRLLEKVFSPENSAA